MDMKTEFAIEAAKAFMKTGKGKRAIFVLLVILLFSTIGIYVTIHQIFKLILLCLF